MLGGKKKWLGSDCERLNDTHFLIKTKKKSKSALVVVLSDYINNIYSLKKKITRYKAKSKMFPFGTWTNAPTSESDRQGLNL